MGPVHGPLFAFGAREGVVLIYVNHCCLEIEMSEGEELLLPRTTTKSSPFAFGAKEGVVLSSPRRGTRVPPLII